jgi:hypothetical protein
MKTLLIISFLFNILYILRIMDLMKILSKNKIKEPVSPCGDWDGTDGY